MNVAFRPEPRRLRASEADEGALAPDRQHADGRTDQGRGGALPAVPQARRRQSRRLDQGPAGAVDDRGGGTRRAARARRDDRRGDRRQHRPRPRAGRRGQGLPARSRHSRQDEPGEDLSPEGDGRRGRADALRRRQGPSGLLPGQGGAHRRRDAGAVFINQFGNPANPLAHEHGHRPGDLRAARRRRSTRSSAASAPAAR